MHRLAQTKTLVRKGFEKSFSMKNAYILKGGICGIRIPQTIWNFRRKIVWERKKYQDYTVCRANWRSFPLLMLSHCNKLSIKTLKHTIFSMKIPHWHQILVIFMIYALLSRNFDVRIYALFPQIFGNWKVDSADFFTFRMYDQKRPPGALYVPLWNHWSNHFFQVIWQRVPFKKMNKEGMLVGLFVNMYHNWERKEGI